MRRSHTGCRPPGKMSYIFQSLGYEWAMRSLRKREGFPTFPPKMIDAMVAIERDNPTLKSVLPKDYNRHALDKQPVAVKTILEQAEILCRNQCLNFPVHA